MSNSNSNSKVKKVYIEAYARDENGDGPAWAEIENITNLVERITSLQQLVQQNKLSEARVWWLTPATWAPAGIENELRLTGDELVVTSDSFWLTCHPKHANYSCETRGQEISAFIDALANAQGAHVFFGADPQELAERVLEALDAQPE